MAANGDRKIGELVAKAFEEVGEDGLFNVSDTLNSNSELQVFNIMKLDWGPLSPFFISNSKKYKCVLENPSVLISESEILNKNVVELAMMMTGYKPLLVVAENVEDAVAGSICLEKTCLQTKVCVVTPPKGQNNWKEIMQDIAILTGSQVFTGSYDFNRTPLILGSCKEVTVSVDEMVIVGGSCSQATIEKRREQLRSSIKLNTSIDELKLLEKRLEMLSRSIAILKVGGASNFKKKSILNAIRTVRLAMTVGVVPGAGVALLHASKGLDNLPITNSCEMMVKKLMLDALKMPVHTIASAFGFDGSSVIQKLLDQDNPCLGYDPTKGEVVDIRDSGIIEDPSFAVSELIGIECELKNNTPFISISNYE